MFVILCAMAPVTKTKRMVAVSRRGSHDMSGGGGGSKCVEELGNSDGGRRCGSTWRECGRSAHHSPRHQALEKTHEDSQNWMRQICELQSVH